MNQASQSLGWLVAALGALGCRSLERFDTQHGELYCGSLVGRQDISTGFDDPRWDGKSKEPTMALTLTTGELYKAGGSPAVVTTSDESFGPCNPDPLFKQAKLRTIDKALGDRLSSLQLGEDHAEDAVAFVDSTCSGSMVAILSLIQNGDVELRLLRPAPNTAKAGTTAANATTPASTADSIGTPRFGLFVLKKSKEGCGS